MEPSQSYDYFIIGQGLAGTLMAHMLTQRGKRVLLFDPAHQNAASAVAAGIINPITGRRFVKSWRIDELLPVARQTYREIETLLNIRCFHERNILRALFSIREENDWQGRSSLPANLPYAAPQADPSSHADIVHPPLSWMELKGCAQLDISTLIQAYRSYWLARHTLIDAPFDYQQVQIKGDGLYYQQFHAEGIICCEGQQARQNPWFQHLPFEPAKGEVLIIRIPGFQQTKILKHRLIIASLGEELYWVGANYEWKVLTEEPTEEGRQWLVERLEKILDYPYTIVDHLAAIRPTVKDRRPFLGRHPEHQTITIFNGLGTKGASIGPFWAEKMAQYLLDGKALDSEVDIQRFD